MTDSLTYRPDGSLVAADGKGVEVIRLAALASALKLYATAGIRPNRRVSPRELLRQANAATGANYRRGQYAAAAEGVLEKMRALRDSLPHKTQD